MLAHRDTLNIACPVQPDEIITRLAPMICIFRHMIVSQRVAVQPPSKVAVQGCIPPDRIGSRGILVYTCTCSW